MGKGIIQLLNDFVGNGFTQRRQDLLREKQKTYIVPRVIVRL